MRRQSHAEAKPLSFVDDSKDCMGVEERPVVALCYNVASIVAGTALVREKTWVVVNKFASLDVAFVEEVVAAVGRLLCAALVFPLSGLDLVLWPDFLYALASTLKINRSLSPKRELHR